MDEKRWNDEDWTEASRKTIADLHESLYEKNYARPRQIPPRPRRSPAHPRVQRDEWNPDTDLQWQAWLKGTDALNRPVSNPVVVSNPHRQNWHVRMRAAVSRSCPKKNDVPFGMFFAYAGVWSAVAVVSIIANAFTSHIGHYDPAWYWSTYFLALGVLIAHWMGVALPRSRRDVVRFDPGRWSDDKQSHVYNRMQTLADCIEALQSASMITLGMWKEKAAEALTAVIETMWRMAVLSRVSNKQVEVTINKQVKDCQELTQTILTQAMIGSTGPHAAIVAQDVAFLLESLKELDE